MNRILIGKLFLLLGLFSISASSFAHEVSAEDILALRALSGIQLPHYLWLGAKHMLTGYDHLLFLLGVIFYIKRLKDVLVLVSFFAIGHSITLIAGVAFSWNVNPFLVDAIIGFSVAYKGFDNLNGFKTFLGERPNEKIVVLIFGLFHGLGLATKLQALAVRDEGLIPNLLAFNVGVELGQITALIAALILLKYVSSLRTNKHIATSINIALMTAGFVLLAYQLKQYFLFS
jgi:hypothetical protein